MTTSNSDAAAVIRSNPGETLRKARENRNLSLQEVAGQLNLTVTALSNLESGAFDRLPGHTFARGYIRAYGKLLGMDQNRLVMEFDQFTDTDAYGAPVHSLGRIEEPVRVAQNLMRMVSLVLLAVLMVAGFFWWQGQPGNQESLKGVLNLEHVEVESADGTTQIHPIDEPEDQAVQLAESAPEIAPVVSAEAVVAAPMVGQSAVAPPTVQLQTAATSEQPDGNPPATQSQAAESGVQTQVDQSAAASQPPAPVTANVQPDAAVVPVAAAGEGLVSIGFGADCWVQLTDANGKVLFSALKRAGESVELVGKTPLELRLGYAAGAQVHYNGQPVDLAPFTSGETARLKLGQ